jgi:hypothetical protein
VPAQKKSAGEHVQTHIEWLWVVGFIALLGAANAQTPSPSAATTQFDGTYALASSTKVNETYTTPGGRIGECPDGRAGSLTITNGQARLQFYEGTVGSQGELAMRRVPEPVKRGGMPGVEGIVTGRIEKDGTVRGRRTTRGCSYDLVWQKVSK